jgi:uncharacterized membrane protein
LPPCRCSSPSTSSGSTSWRSTSTARGSFNLPVGLAFYLLYIVGIIVFAVLPGVEKGSVVEALWRGALLGLVAYGTYDLTNLSTLKDWSPAITVVDMVWGTVLTGTVASASWWIAGLLGFKA